MAVELAVANVVVLIVVAIMLFSFVVVCLGYDPFVCLCSTTYCRGWVCDCWGRIPEDEEKTFEDTERQKALDKRRVRVVPAAPAVVAPAVTPQPAQPAQVTPVVKGEVVQTVDAEEEGLPFISLSERGRRHVSNFGVNR